MADESRVKRMSFIDAVSTCFRKYVGFQGRAQRAEYWYFTLFLIIISVIASIIDSSVFDAGAMEPQPISGIIGVVTLLPGLAVSVRRLHDIGKSGWWLLIAFTLIGVIWLIIWACRKSEPGTNRFGDGPIPNE